MFSQMFTGIDGDGPFGGGGKAGVWRSFLTEEYAKSFAKAGGIGIADHVYRALLAAAGSARPINAGAAEDDHHGSRNTQTCTTPAPVTTAAEAERAGRALHRA